MQLCEVFFVLCHVIILNVAHTTRRKNREKPDNFQKPPKNDFTVVYGKLSFSFLMGQVHTQILEAGSLNNVQKVIWGQLKIRQNP